MVFVTGGTAILVSLSVTIYLLYGALSHIARDKRCLATFPIRSKSGVTTGCFTPTNVVKTKCMGWIGANASFTEFHRTLPPKQTLSGNCRPWATETKYSLMSVESTYRRGTRQESLGSTYCSRGLCCLVQATYQNGSWSVRNRSYQKIQGRATTMLHGHRRDLEARAIHHLVVCGPLYGALSFQPIHYSLRSTFKNHTGGQIRRTATCRVTLGSGAPDGLLVLTRQNWTLAPREAEFEAGLASVKSYPAE